jgi:type IV secretory pathway VirB10-like protein
MHRMTPWKKIIVVLVTLSASLALADDFKTTNGKEYKDATVTHVEIDGITVKTKSGISKLYFGELPKEVQQRFHYDPQTAAAYSAQQAAQYEADQKHQEEVRHRQEAADAQNRANVANQQAANARAQAEQDNAAVKEAARHQEAAAKEADRHQEALQHASRYHRRHR